LACVKDDDTSQDVGGVRSFVRARRTRLCQTRNAVKLVKSADNGGKTRDDELGLGKEKRRCGKGQKKV